MKPAVKPISFFSLSALLFFSLFTAGCTDNKDHLALIQGKPITVEKFKAELQKRVGRVTTGKDKEQLLQELVDFEVIYAAAVKKGYDKDPQILKNLRRMIAGKLRKEGLDPLINAINVSDDEIEKYYNDHPKDFMTPARVRAALIKVAVTKKVSAEKKAKLRRRIDDARTEALALDSNTLSFGSAAVKYSDDLTTRYRGGNTGWLEPGRKNYRRGKEVIEAIFSLREPGEVSQVIEAEDGFYIVKLMERQESRPRDLRQVAGRIRFLLVQEKQAQAERGFYDGLKKDVSIKIYKERLAGIDIPEPPEKKPPKPPGLPGRE